MIEETMLTYIRKEQESLLEILESRHSILLGFEEWLNHNKPKQWTVLSTGSSSNAILSAKFYVEKIADVKVTLEVPTLYSYYDHYVDPKALYIGVSQTGKSSSTIESLRNLKVERFALTAELNSPITEEVQYVLPINIEKETVDIVTLGFSATVLTFWLMGLEAARIWKRISPAQYKIELKRIKDTILSIDTMINYIEAWERENRNLFSSIEHINIIGFGPGFGVSKEAETKFVETLTTPANGYELEEFMHGPNYAINQSKTYFLIRTGEGHQAERTNQLFNYIKRFTLATAQFYLNQILGKPIEELLSPLLTVIPFQYLAYKMSENLGIDPMHTPHDDFDKEFNSKI